MRTCRQRAVFFGVLKAYEVMLRRGGSRPAVLDEQRQKDQSGTLEAHVAAAWTKRRGQGA
ncbi:hypothetical protein [Sorangium sp. So ce887]|uniref:hypothetical protein n=1 Tax=Sorangium sp. So ce887 TaxID=3133324 RepID=UPI003F63A2DD